MLNKATVDTHFYVLAFIQLNTAYEIKRWNLRYQLSERMQFMKKVNIKFVDVFDDSKSFGDCLNDLLDKYYTTEGASASSVFLSLFDL